MKVPNSLHRWLCYSFVLLLVLTAAFQLHQTQLLQYGPNHKRSIVSKEQRIIPFQDGHHDNLLSSPALPDNPSFSNSQYANITFPHGHAVKSNVLEAPWVSSIRNILHSSRTTELNLVVSDAKFQAILLNWLISALVKSDKPLKNVIVLSFDSKLQDLLEFRKIPSVYVDSDTVVRSGTEMQTRHSHIWITRTTIYRLLSFWGYDITIFDTDAIIVKNPKVLFDAHKDSDIVGSAGTYPFPLGKKWGVTFCMGVALFRHTQRTELLWEALSNSKNSSLDDQVKLNYALDKCDVTWLEPTDNILTEVVKGRCAANKLGGLKVAILPHNAICRKSTCSQHYYIFHRNSRKESKAKVKIAKAGGVWFLRDDWISINHTMPGRGFNSSSERLTGTNWLNAISTPS